MTTVLDYTRDDKNTAVDNTKVTSNWTNPKIELRYSDETANNQRWYLAVREYEVTFEEGNGGTFTTPNDPLANRIIQEDATIDEVPEITANHGFIFRGWKKEGDAADTIYTVDEVKALQITAVTKFTAAYDEIPKFTVRFDAGANGAFATDNTVAAEQIVQKDETVAGVPAITADAGYTFKGWQKDGAGEPYTTEEVAALPINAPTAFTAIYEEIPKVRYDVTFQAGENGSFTGTSDLKTVIRTVEEGQNVADVPVATANEGYTFAGWQRNGAGDIYTAEQVAAMQITENITFVAAYTQNSSNSGGSSKKTYYTIHASAGEGGTITPSGYVSVRRGSDKTFEISADTGYQISDVLVDGESVGAVKSYTFTNVHQGHTIEIVYQRIAMVVEEPTNTGVSEYLNTENHIAFMTGFGNGIFAPNDAVTRAQVAQMFYNLLKDQDVAVTVSFADVPENEWYSKAVHTLASLDVLSGVGNGNFEPNRPITRAEFTAIASRFVKAREEGTVQFSDVLGGEWYYNHVLTAVRYGWLAGYEDNTFRPNNTITRAEAAAIVNRMLARSADREFVNNSNAIRSYTDVQTAHWAYFEIMEATNGHDHSKENGIEKWTGLQ